MATLLPLSDTNEITCWENRPFINKWPELEQQNRNNNDILITKIVRKKNKRNRTAYTTEQLRLLEKTFASSKYVDVKSRKELANYLGISEKCIKVWFQNRRMKQKKDASGSSCDSSSENIKYECATPPPVQPVTQNGEMNINPDMVSYLNMQSKNVADYYPAYEGGYHNIPSNNYVSYNNSYNCGNFYGDPMYPGQYYQNSTYPEYSYTNLGNDQNANQTYNGCTDVPNWSADAIDMKYF